MRPFTPVATRSLEEAITMQHMKFRNYKLHYTDRDAAESMVRQIDDFPSFFTPSGDRPLIIDCGANIGVTVLEWKARWPHCEIICFEPDPFAFEALQTNIERNDIPGVKCLNVALADHEGTVDLYGDISAQGDARGNSIDPAWAERGYGDHTSVESHKLSRYLDREVSFLKLDIEGAEQRVVEEIAGHLKPVQAIYVEVHETDDSVEYNSADQIERLLTDAGFTIEVTSRYEEHALPAHLDDWRLDVGARQVEMLCWK